MSIVDALPTWLKDTSMGKKLVAEKTANELADRQQRVATREQIRADETERRPSLEKTLEDKRKKLGKTEAAKVVAEEEVQTAYNALRRLSLSSDHQVGLIDGELRTSADPAIDDFIRELADMGDATRKMRPRSQEAVVNRDEFNRPIFAISHSSRPSILARMSAIREAVQTAEVLRLQAIENLPAAIDAIRQGIPSGTEMVPLEA